jgi:lactosylceramide 4-alpha-galactosyltransferase
MRNGSWKGNTEIEPKPGDKNIIFIETGCIKKESPEYMGLKLHKRQVCAIESAARNNPDYKVYLLYSCPVHGRLADSSEYVQAILTYPNVNLLKLDTKRYFSKTPLENWDFMAAMMNSSYPVEHASDVLRFLSLWKYGGTYLDTDFVILR